MLGWVLMMLRSCHTLVAVIISLLSVIVLSGFTYDAHAATVITVDDEDSCLALPLSGGTATWDMHDNGGTATCTIPDGATLQIDADEVLDLHVSLSPTNNVDTTGTITNMQGGIINVYSGASLRSFRFDGVASLDNHGTINIRAGAGASFDGLQNHPTGIVNNNGNLAMAGLGCCPGNDNYGTINNYADGVISLFGDGNFRNNAKGVINNHGLMFQDTSAETGKFHSAGVINNYGEVAANANTAPGGLFNNFGTIEIGSSQQLHIQGHLSNHGDIRNGDGRIFNDDGGSIVNQAVGSIANFDQFINSGSINNEGVISNYCGITFTNSGSITGNPVENACESVPPAITAPADVTLTTTGTRLNLCKNIPVSGISAIGDDGAGNVAANTLDNNLGTRWSHGGAGSWIRPDLGSTKVICSVDIAWYKGDQRMYNFVISLSNDGINFKKVFTGHSSGTTLSPERYEFADFLPTNIYGRYVKIIVNTNSVNSFASVTEINVNGYTSLGLPVVSDNGDPFPLVIVELVPVKGLPLGSNPVIWTATDANGNTNSDTQIVKVINGDTPRPTVRITSPEKDPQKIVTLTGPSSGVILKLKGTAVDAEGGIDKVEVKVNDADTLRLLRLYKLATPTGLKVDDFSTWAKTLTFDKEGTYRVCARATDEEGNQNWWHVLVKVEFTDQDS